MALPYRTSFFLVEKGSQLLPPQQLVLDWTTGLRFSFFLGHIWATGWGVTNHWTGLLDWNTGLDYWTDIFLVFTHPEVGFIESC